eukprot:1846230-Amphidinium_carterae.1
MCSCNWSPCPQGASTSNGGSQATGNPIWQKMLEEPMFYANVRISASWTPNFFWAMSSWWALVDCQCDLYDSQIAKLGLGTHP